MSVGHFGDSPWNSGPRRAIVPGSCHLGGILWHSLFKKLNPKFQHLINRHKRLLFSWDKKYFKLNIKKEFRIHTQDGHAPQSAASWQIVSMVNCHTRNIRKQNLQTMAQAPVRKRYLCSRGRITSTLMFQSKLTWGPKEGQGHLHLYSLEPLVSEEHCDVCGLTTGRKTGAGPGAGSTALCPQGDSSTAELSPGLRRASGAGRERRQRRRRALSIPFSPCSCSYGFRALHLFIPR